jgi:(2Fe-2S) ferredoxin
LQLHTLSVVNHREGVWMSRVDENVSNTNVDTKLLEGQI